MHLSQGFQASKELAFEDYEEGLASLPWVNLDMEYARQVLGKDIAPYGVKSPLRSAAAVRTMKASAREAS